MTFCFVIVGARRLWNEMDELSYGFLYVGTFHCQSKVRDFGFWQEKFFTNFLQESAHANAIGYSDDFFSSHRILCLFSVRRRRSRMRSKNQHLKGEENIWRLR